MNTTKNPKIETKPYEPKSLRLLRVLTLTMTIVMIFGFIIIVSLLSIAINKNINRPNDFNLAQKVNLKENEILLSVTYMPNYTFIFFNKSDNTQNVRILSNKTGKTLSNTLISDLINENMDQHK